MDPSLLTMSEASDSRSKELEAIIIVTDASFSSWTSLRIGIILVVDSEKKQTRIDVIFGYNLILRQFRVSQSIIFLMIY
jgi:hypothetical protein